MYFLNATIPLYPKSNNEDNKKLLNNAMENLGMSARAFHRILKVARTIADLADSDNIEREHLTESLGYRQLQKK